METAVNCGVDRYALYRDGHWNLGDKVPCDDNSPISFTAAFNWVWDTVPGDWQPFLAAGIFALGIFLLAWILFRLVLIDLANNSGRSRAARERRAIRMMRLRAEAEADGIRVISEARNKALKRRLETLAEFQVEPEEDDDEPTPATDDGAIGLAGIAAAAADVGVQSHSDGGGAAAHHLTPSAPIQPAPPGVPPGAIWPPIGYPGHPPPQPIQPRR